ncbi:MAG: hypothetical protein JXR36_08050 [Bacteroidales bacterium]|nr:hypothetical protein [Bacteroidales bacterium]MBN2777580.1 hypothetical protein [Bacteroidales bacterium]
MNSNKNVKLIEMKPRTAADWKPIINGFNVIFNVAISELIKEGLNDDDADDVACCVQEFKFLQKDVLSSLKEREEVCHEN